MHNAGRLGCWKRSKEPSSRVAIGSRRSCRAGPTPSSWMPSTSESDGQVTLKVVRPEHARDPRCSGPQVPAARRMSTALTHPNIALILDWVRSSCVVHHRVLDGRRTRRWQPAATCSTAGGCSSHVRRWCRFRDLRALDAAHPRPVPHRAHPVEDGLRRRSSSAWRPGRFGIGTVCSRSRPGPTPRSCRPTLLATPHPSRRWGSRSTKTDMYALALVMIEAVTGFVPFAPTRPSRRWTGRVDLPPHVGRSRLPARVGPRRADRPESAGSVTAAELGRALVRPRPVPSRADSDHRPRVPSTPRRCADRRPDGGVDARAGRRLGRRRRQNRAALVPVWSPGAAAGWPWRPRPEQQVPDAPTWTISPTSTMRRRRRGSRRRQGHDVAKSRWRRRRGGEAGRGRRRRRGAARDAASATADDDRRTDHVQRLRRLVIVANGGDAAGDGPAAVRQGRRRASTPSRSRTATPRRSQRPRRMPVTAATLPPARRRWSGYRSEERARTRRGIMLLIVLVAGLAALGYAGSLLLADQVVRGAGARRGSEDEALNQIAATAGRSRPYANAATRSPSSTR